MKLRITCEWCCHWSTCFAQTELVSIIRSHNSLKHIRGWKKIADMQEVVLLSGHFSSSPFLWCSQVWLTRALQTFACYHPSTEWEQCRYLHARVGRWPTMGSPLVLFLLSTQLKAASMLCRQGGGVSCDGVQGDFIILCPTWQLCLV